MYIIGEIGSNCKNHLEAKELIKRLKESGASAVKFQWVSFEKLYGFDPEVQTEDIWTKIKDDLVKKDLRLHKLSLKDIKEFSEYAKQIGIDFLCSVFSPEDVKKLDPLVTHHKVASCEISDKMLIDSPFDF